MYDAISVEGINLEKLLCTAAREGIVIRSARREGGRRMHVKVRADQRKAFLILCERNGWSAEVVCAGRLVRLIRLLRRRLALVPSLAISLLLIGLSSRMILCVSVEHALEHEPQVRRVLRQENIWPGILKAAVSLDDLRAKLAHALPGIAFSGAYFSGSTLIVQAYPAVQKEVAYAQGSALDIVAARSGIVSGIWAFAGTPQVQPGQTVRKGQVLIAGYERGEKGAQIPVKAQGQVTARIYAQGEARASLKQMRSVETGQTRTRISLCTPWGERVVKEAQPFSSQDTSRKRQRLVGLYLPVWLETQTYAQTEVFSSPRAQADAASAAQGAAEKIARKQCPPDVLILDKWVNYSMIDNEFVYASVVLEYEAPVAGRIQ